MTFPIFGEEVSEESSFPEFGEIVEEKPSRLRSVISAPIKGAIKEAADITSSLPIGLGGAMGAISPELLGSLVEKYLPTEKEPLEKGLERAGRLGLTAIGGPENILLKGLRTGLGAIGGQVLEEMGAPKFLQSLAELSAFISPRFGKEIIPKEKQKEAVKFLREKGFSEKQIVPLIKSDSFINRWLSKVSAKGKKTEQLSKEISSKLGENYDLLKSEGRSKFLQKDEVTKFDDLLSDSLEKINPRFRRLIEKDIDTLRDKGFSQENLINFYQDINAIVGKQEGGKAVLNILKNPVIQGMEKIDPNAARDFVKINEFYSKGKKFLKGLKPSFVEKIFSGTKSLAMLGSLALGKFGFLPGVMGTHGAQVAVREFLLNPRLQNLSQQLLKSISENNFSIARRTFDLLDKELKKSESEGSEEIRNHLQDLLQENQKLYE